MENDHRSVFSPNFVMEFITWVLCCEQNVDLFGVTKKHAF